MQGEIWVRTSNTEASPVKDTNPFPVALYSIDANGDKHGLLLLSTGALVVSGQTSRVSATFTRPADTTAYTALDTVSDSTSAPTLLTFSNVASFNGGGGYITKARIVTDQKTCVARFRLHLFHTAPTAINDNSPYLSLYANKDKSLGRIDFSAAATEDATNSTAATSLNADVRLAYVCASGTRNIYGVLEALDAFTPASGQGFYVELTAEQN